MNQRIRFAVGLSLAVAAGLVSEARAATPFTIAVIGDQQVPSSNVTFYPSFTAQTDWLAANAQAENIRFVTQVGDIIEHGSSVAEYVRAEAAMATLDTATNADGGSGIPWNVAYGNHEEDSSLGGTDPAGAWANRYREYFGSNGGATHRYAGQAGYGGVSSNDLNTYHTIQSSAAAGATEYLMLNLEYDVPGHPAGSTPDPGDVPVFDAIAWGQGIIDAHYGMPTIITTHVFEGTAFGPPNNPWQAGPGRNSQLQIFDKLVKDNPQVFMVLSGHTSQETYQVKANAAGLPVLQMVTDYTKWLPNGGDGFMRLVELDEDAGEIRVETFTPGVPQNPTPRYRTGANSQFVVAMDWDTRFDLGTGPIMGPPTVGGIADDGATPECRLINADADDVTLVWAFADQGETTVGAWTAAPGGGSHSFGAASEGDVLSRTLAGLNGDTEYSFRFFATGGGESDWSTGRSFATGLGGSPAPAGFSGVAGTIVNGNKVDLSWTDSFATETGFVIRRSTDPAFASFDEFTVAADGTSYSDQTPAPNTTYYYRIAAQGGAGTGVFTSNLEVMTGDAGAGPVAGLIGHWTFDENAGTTAADSSANGNLATTTADSWTTGVSGSAADQPRYTLADSSDLDMSGSVPVSISLWAKTSAAHSFTILAGFEGTGNTGDIYGIKLENGNVRFTGPNTEYSTQTFQDISNGNWVHIVGVNDPGSGNSKLYIDGSEVASGAVGNIPVRANLQWTMGSYWNSNSYNFDGSLDDVQVYNTALSAADVALLYNSPGSPLGATPTSITMGVPSASAIADDGATVECQVLSDDADGVTLVWAFADQGETAVGTWESAPGGGSHSFGAANQDQVLSRMLGGLNGDTQYHFRFFASAGGDSDWSAAATFATGLAGSPAPADFAGVAGTDATGTKVDLSWTDSFDNESGFVLRRSTDAGFVDFDEFAVVADQTSFTDDTTAPNTTYHYRIAADGSTGRGPFSAGIEVATGDAPSTPGPAGSLIGHWTFDEGGGTTAADSSGNDYDANQSVAAGSWVAGKADDAYNLPRFALDAAGSAAVKNGGGSAVTLSAWVTTRTGTNFEGIAGFENTGTGNDVYSLKMDNADKFNWTVDGNAIIISPDTLTNYAAAVAGDWVHVAGVFEQGSTHTLYVNGSPVVSSASNGNPIQNDTSTFGIGSYQGGSSYAFTGSVDDVQVYHEALEASDIAFLFNNPGSPLPAPAPLFSGWIDGFGLDPADQGFGHDPDGDLLVNGLEAWFGTHPGEFDAGLGGISSDGITTTFTHPQNDSPPSDLTGSYQWSPNLSDWFSSGSGPAGGVVVTLVPNTVGAQTTVTATASGAMPRLFVRVSVIQN